MLKIQRKKNLIKYDNNNNNNNIMKNTITTKKKIFNTYQQARFNLDRNKSI